MLPDNYFIFMMFLHHNYLNIVFLVDLFLFKCFSSATATNLVYVNDICGHFKTKRIFLERFETGMLNAEFDNNIQNKFNAATSQMIQNRCSVELVTCPSCIFRLKFKYLNVSQVCERSTVFENCGCDYVWIYEPEFEQTSGEQFCGHNNLTSLNYISNTRRVAVNFFFFDMHYGRAFSLEYTAEKNRRTVVGYPKPGNLNNASQIISSPYFPQLYPPDFISEQIIKCETPIKTCRISLIFLDFLIAPSSIIEFFDSNDESRIFVANGDTFRPPIIITNGPSLIVRFYGNGMSSFGYKAQYSFILRNLNNPITPDIDCGGRVSNLGGGITMLNVTEIGLKTFDCIWLVKPPESYYNKKTHLYVKVVSFEGFVGSTELVIRQGLTSIGPVVENLKLPLKEFLVSNLKEHVAPLSLGFYVSFKGIFLPSSKLIISYAAFSYKNCLVISDHLCNNLRCISRLLNCDGFDHCGDNSDEAVALCSTKDYKDKRNWYRAPNFIFPPNDNISNLNSSTVIFLMCSFGLIGAVLVLIMVLYRVNMKNVNRRQIQDHIETINAILEESVVEIDEEEELIFPDDDPPNYEAPPDYVDVMNKSTSSVYSRCSNCSHLLPTDSMDNSEASRNFQTIPDSPPPAYERTPNTYAFGHFSNMDTIQTRNINIGLARRRARNGKNCKLFSKEANHLFLPLAEVSDKYFSDSELIIFKHNSKKLHKHYCRSLNYVNL